MTPLEQVLSSLPLAKQLSRLMGAAMANAIDTDLRYLSLGIFVMDWPSLAIVMPWEEDA